MLAKLHTQFISIFKGRDWQRSRTSDLTDAVGKNSPMMGTNRAFMLMDTDVTSSSYRRARDNLGFGSRSLVLRQRVNSTVD